MLFAVCSGVHVPVQVSVLSISPEETGENALASQG